MKDFFPAMLRNVIIVLIVISVAKIAFWNVVWQFQRLAFDFVIVFLFLCFLDVIRILFKNNR